MGVTFVCVILLQFHRGSCDWLSGWEQPVREQLMEPLRHPNLQSQQTEVLSADPDEPPGSLRDKLGKQINIFTSQLQNLKNLKGPMNKDAEIFKERTDDLTSIKNFRRPENFYKSMDYYRTLTEDLLKSVKTFRDPVENIRRPLEDHRVPLGEHWGLFDDHKELLEDHRDQFQDHKEPLEDPRRTLDYFLKTSDGAAEPDKYFGALIEELKHRLHTTLERAKSLAETLKQQISATDTKENLLKEAIINGRSGVTAVRIYRRGQEPRLYLVRDGRWSECAGTVRPPVGEDEPEEADRRDPPRCFGKERAAFRDPCAFTAVNKYEVVPQERAEVYAESEFYCLHHSSNSSVQRYMSVPRRIVNDTCREGVVSTLQEENNICGERTLSEYSYYPSAETAGSLPLEYCGGGVCPLLVAWRISRDSLDNIVSFAKVKNFRKFFIDSFGRSYNLQF